MISCGTCHVKFETSYLLGEHHGLTACKPLILKAAVGQPPSLCQFCDHFFDTDYHLGRHQGSYECIIGKPSTSVSPPLAEPSTAPSYLCAACQIECPSVYFLKKHRSTCLAFINSEQNKPKPRVNSYGKRRYPCPNCGEVFDDRLTWRFHMKTYVKGERVYWCPNSSCSFTVRTLSAMKRHLNSHPGKYKNIMFVE